MSTKRASAETDGAPRLSVVDGGKSKPRKRRNQDYPVTYVTFSLIAINFVIFALAWYTSGGDLARGNLLFGDKENQLIRAGQIWRLLTPIFLHGSLLHVGSNCFSLIMLGRPMEQMYGARKFLLVYMFAGVLSFILSFVMSPYPSVGASGAIFGLVGAGIVFPIRYRKLINPQARSAIVSQLVTVAAINLTIGFIPGSHIDNWAHVGGMIGGGLIALVLIPDVLEDRVHHDYRDLLISAAVAATLVITLSAAFFQIRWAVQQVRRGLSDNAIAMKVYAPSLQDPWWTICVPQNWKPLQGAWEWQSPIGATLRVVDSAYEPKLVQEAMQIIHTAGPNADMIQVDRKPSWRIALPLPDRIRTLCLIQPYPQTNPSRLLLIVMDCRQNIYGSVQADYSRVLDNFRVVHPPHDAAEPAEPAKAGTPTQSPEKTGEPAEAPVK